jgi:hypothetical protein
MGLARRATWFAVVVGAETASVWFKSPGKTMVPGLEMFFAQSF